MYYYLKRIRSKEIIRVFSVFLILTLFLIIFPKIAFAEQKEKLAEDYRLKGYEAQKEGDLEKALSFYAKAAELNETPATYNDMGVIYEQLGLIEKAEHYYLNATLLDRHYLPSYSNLAYLYEKKGDLKKATEYFKKRITMSEVDDVWVERSKQRLYRIGNTFPEARRWVIDYDRNALQRKIKEKAQNAFQEKVEKAIILAKEGEKLLNEKQFKHALIKFDQALALTPKNPKIIRARNKARLEVIKQDARMHAENGLRFLKLGDTTSAKIEFRKILTIIPDEPIHIIE